MRKYRVKVVTCYTLKIFQCPSKTTRFCRAPTVLVQALTLGSLSNNTRKDNIAEAIIFLSLLQKLTHHLKLDWNIFPWSIVCETHGANCMPAFDVFRSSNQVRRAIQLLQEVSSYTIMFLRQFPVSLTERSSGNTPGQYSVWFNSSQQ